VSSTRTSTVEAEVVLLHEELQGLKQRSEEYLWKVMKVTYQRDNTNHEFKNKNF
jgi:hypothetical protein